ncbi:eukaryotic aspartyl protease, partial [Opisthorchis viverrini]
MSVVGRLVEDTLIIGGYTFQDFKFLEVTEMSRAPGKNTLFDGVFGLVLDMTSLEFHPTLLGMMQECGLIEEYSVAFRFCGIRYGELVLCSDCEALIDTGGYYISGPKELIKKVHLQMTVREVTEHGVYVECKHIHTYPDLEVTMGGTTYKVTADKLIMEEVRKRDRKCLSGFISKNSESSWTLGLPFLHNFLTVFQLMDQQIGFAK